MSIRYRRTAAGTFEVTDRQDLVAKFFGGVMLFFSGCFLYWLGVAVVELARCGTWRDVLVSVPGAIVALLMAALFGVPGALMALLGRRTVCDDSRGVIRQVRSVGVIRWAREIRAADVQRVVAAYRTTRRFVGRGRSGVPVHTVSLALREPPCLELGQFGSWDAALALGRQLADYLGVEFRDETGK